MVMADGKRYKCEQFLYDSCHNILVHSAMLHVRARSWYSFKNAFYADAGRTYMSSILFYFTNTVNGQAILKRQAKRK